MQPRALVIAAVVLCAAVVSAFDPFIADEHATAEVAPIRAAAPEQPLPAPAKSVQEPAATPQPTPPRPPAALATPADVQSPVPPTKGEPAVPAPVPIGPAKPVVRSPSVNVTAVPTATPSIKQRALEAKKSGGSNALFDVKVKGTRVAITPSGDVMVRNPDIDINTMRVVQMVAGLVKAAKRVAEAAQTRDKRAEKQQSVSHAKSSDSDEKENESDDDDDGDDDDENDKGKPKGKGAQAPPVIVKQKVTIAGGDADGVSARMQPLPQDVIGDGPVRSSGGSLVDDAKPYARKLHYRVRRDYTRGAGSVGDLRFDAPITMQLQQISTIPRSEFAPDSYRFAVDVPGQPLFFVDLPQRQ